MHIYSDKYLYIKIKDLDAGRHTIVIKAGTVVKKTSIKIKPLKLKVKAKKVTARLGQNKKFKIVLTDKKGNRIKDDVDLKIRIYTGKKYRTFEIETNLRELLISSCPDCQEVHTRLSSNPTTMNI